MFPFKITYSIKLLDIHKRYGEEYKDEGTKVDFINIS